MASQTPVLLRQHWQPQHEFVVIYHEHASTQMPLVSFSRELLELGPPACAQALLKLRKLEESLLAPRPNSRAPP